MNARLGRKARQDGEGVEPVQVVGDQHVGTVGGNELPTVNPDPEERMQERHSPQPQSSIGEGGLALHRK